MVSLRGTCYSMGTLWYFNVPLWSYEGTFFNTSTVTLWLPLHDALLNHYRYIHDTTLYGDNGTITNLFCITTLSFKVTYDTIHNQVIHLLDMFF